MLQSMMHQTLVGKNMLMDLGLKLHILPEDHILLPDHKWGNPAGDWPTGTPSLPLFNANISSQNPILSNIIPYFKIKIRSLYFFTWLYVSFPSW